MSKVQAVIIDPTSGHQLAINSDGQMAVDVGGLNINPGDIQIGAVEIKNHSTDDRAVVKTDGVDFALVVQENASATLYDGSQATSTTAAALNGGTSQAIKEVVVTNTDAALGMLLGSATSQSTPLKAGQSIVLPVNNLNKVYVKSVSGTPAVAWLGRS